MPKGNFGHAGRPGLVGGSQSKSNLNQLFLMLKGSSRSGNFGHAGRKGKRGGSAPNSTISLPDTFSTKNAESVKRKADRWLPTIAKEYGLTVEEYKDKLENKMREELDSAEIKIRVSEKALSSILKDTEIKNTFETNKSSSAYKENKLSYGQYLDERDSTEKNMFGGDQKPIYGFLEKEQDKAALYTDHYGDVQIILKNNVKGRSTFGDADSLDWGENRYIPSPIGKPSAYSSLYLTNSSDPLAVWNEKGIDGLHYAEAQIFGRVTLSDIDRIHFDKQPTAKTIAKLEEKGIKWTTSK